MTTTIAGIDDLRERVGEHLGYSEWHEVTQEQVNLFADATGDHQWIHVDVERAKAGPFGAPIAHGYLTLSLATELILEAVHIVGVTMGINYGLNKVRFPAPVPVGSKLRASVTLAAADEVADGVQVALATTFEIEGGTKPVCVAEILFRYYS
jgi:acyl dehydratase